MAETMAETARYRGKRPRQREISDVLSAVYEWLRGRHRAARRWSVASVIAGEAR